MSTRAPAEQRSTRLFAWLCWAFILALSFGTAHRGHAAEFIVSNTNQFNSAVKSLKPGDSLVLSNGTWANADLLFKGKGTPSAPIYLKPQTPGKVLLTGNSRLRLSGQHLLVDGLVFTAGAQTDDHVIAFRESSSVLATNCRVSNCIITNYHPAKVGQDTKWVSLFGASNRVDHCYFAGKTNLGTVLVVWLPDDPAHSTNYHLIDHNHFGPRPLLGENGAEIIRVGDSSASFNTSRTTVEANLFQECDGEGEIISNKSCENVYRQNTFIGCQGALTLRHGHRCTVTGNFFFGQNKPETGGVRIIGEDHKVYNNYFADLAGDGTRSALTFMFALTNSPLNGYFPVKRAVVAFNTFVNCESSLRIGVATTYSHTGEITSVPPSDCVIANNVVLSTKDDLVDQRAIPPNMLWEGNIMYGSKLGISLNTGIRWIDPKLTPGTDGLWRPSSTSPVLGAACGTYSYVTNDIDGQVRTTTKDSGCDQSGSPSALLRPLTSADVGPAWTKATRPVLQGLSSTMRQFTMRWNATVGASYQVQYSDAFGPWKDVPTTIIGTNSLQTWTDNGSQTGGFAQNGPRLYRIKQLQ